MHERIMTVLLAACLAAPAWASENTLAQLGWLQGCWAAKGAERGSGEHWMAPAGGSMLGMSRTVRRGVTVEYEFYRRIGATSLLARIEGKGKRIDFPISRTPCTAK